ncbi:putative hydrolase of the HAD superfamily [Streptomyces sp. B3I7]|uniref:HAD family hydrolase n=1 Tax=unclassified Streptomyces TaxID=2593676 RepID=UPI00278140F0|nr:putative hydrolase of the HAD superfamily [Streptomyces sp. B3I8]MDQ0809502.1 putative hydrolase of the HAD superfamily [Streptomyces sp. B3I7]
MIRALLVDAGGILFNNVTEETDFLPRLARQHGADPQEVRRQLDLHDRAYETGARHVHAVLADCLNAAGADIGSVEPEWTDSLYMDSVRAYDTAFIALRHLRTGDTGLVLALANNEAEHWDKLKNARYRHFELFDVIGSSWHIGTEKPRSEYFHQLLTACGCFPDEATFVDDNPENVEAARRFGMNSLHVPHPSRLPAALSLLVPAQESSSSP